MRTDCENVNNSDIIVVGFSIKGEEIGKIPFVELDHKLVLPSQHVNIISKHPTS